MIKIIIALLVLGILVGIVFLSPDLFKNVLNILKGFIDKINGG